MANSSVAELFKLLAMATLKNAFIIIIRVPQSWQVLQNH